MDTSSQLATVNQIKEEFISYAKREPLVITVGAVLLAWMLLGKRR
ncbi:MAG: hypothetical protein M0T85_16620 [Dehalococcoidales bacterium]|nr:hypothetical protein [Dehalococcoidales bacterium]